MGADAQVQDLDAGKDLGADLDVALAEDLAADKDLDAGLDVALAEAGDVLELDRAELVQKVAVFDQPSRVMTPQLGPKL